MAVWKKESNVLTNRGNEILSLVSSGVGKLTVTRISSGSGFTPLTDLKGLTDVNTHEQDLELLRTQLSENGSVLSVRLSNHELTEAYNLSQIGVFVTHPNFSGEQLYMIAQCEQDSADFIPLPSDNPVTVNYSLSLVHGSLENLEITVNEADVALKADLDALDGAVLHRVGGEMLNSNLVTNLNADLLDGKQGSEYLLRDGYTEKTEVIPNLNVNFLNGKASTDFAAASHPHGNITNDGKVGTAEGKVLMTSTGGTVIATNMPPTSVPLDSYPVGSIYMSLTATSPATLFGGTWAAIDAGRFLVASGTGYGAGATGGATTHAHTQAAHAHTTAAVALTVAQMPPHTHSVQFRHTTTSHNFAMAMAAANYNPISGATGSAGSGAAHGHGNTGNATPTINSASSLPPYYAVYMWRRTA